MSLTADDEEDVDLMESVKDLSQPSHQWYFVSQCGQSRVITDIQDRLVGILRGASVLLHVRVDVITRRVNDVPIAWADQRRRRPVAVLA